jgi:hypothetical protein
MHAGECPREPFRRDDVTEMQEEEDAAGQYIQHSPSRAAVAYDQKLSPSIDIEETRLGLHSSPTCISASICSSAPSLTPITPSQTRHVPGTTQAPGTPKRDFPTCA